MSDVKGKGHRNTAIIQETFGQITVTMTSFSESKILHTYQTLKGNKSYRNI